MFNYHKDFYPQIQISYCMWHVLYNQTFYLQIKRLFFMPPLPVLQGINCWISFCSGILLYLLLNPYLCFTSLLYLDLWINLLGDDSSVSLGSSMQTKHLCVLIHIRN